MKFNKLQRLGPKTWRSLVNSEMIDLNDIRTKLPLYLERKVEYVYLQSPPETFDLQLVNNTVIQRLTEYLIN